MNTFPQTFEHMTDDGLRDHILALTDYLGTLRGPGPQAERAQNNLNDARAVLRDRLIWRTRKEATT